MDIDLRYFFKPESDRLLLQRPFNFERRTVATTGFSAISVPLLDEYEELPDDELKRYPGLTVLLASLDKDHDFNPLPGCVKIPEPEECGGCKGSGKGTRRTCRECEGDGYVTLKNDFHEYEPICKTCMGAGEWITPGGKQDCPECNGLKVVFREQYRTRVARTKQRDFDINAALLYPFNGDKSLRVAIHGDALILRGDGYKGLIMRMK